MFIREWLVRKCRIRKSSSANVHPRMSRPQMSHPQKSSPQMSHPQMFIRKAATPEKNVFIKAKT
jgi:hypothetical protein